MVSYDKKTVKELRAIAKEKNLTGYSALKKEDLINLIRGRKTKSQKKSPRKTVKPDLTKMTVPQLKSKAIDLEMMSYKGRTLSVLRKQELIDAINEYKSSKPVNSPESPKKSDLSTTSSAKVSRHLVKKEPERLNILVSTITDKFGYSYNLIKIDDSPDYGYYELFEGQDDSFIGAVSVTYKSNRWYLDNVYITNKYIGYGICTPMTSDVLGDFLKERDAKYGYVYIESSFPMSADICYTKAAKNNGFVVYKREEIATFGYDKETFQKKERDLVWREKVWFKRA